MDNNILPKKSVGTLELFSDHGLEAFVIEDLLKSHLMQAGLRLRSIFCVLLIQEDLNPFFYLVSLKYTYVTKGTVGAFIFTKLKNACVG